MKKVLLAIVFASITIAACQKTDIVTVAGTPLEFKGEMVKQTKASGTPSATNDGQMQNLYAQDFRVWAYKNWDDPITKDVNEINQVYDEIENLLISYNSTTKKWDTGLDYYWPGLNKSLKFYAVSSSNWTTPGDTGATGAETVSITHHGNSTSLGTLTINGFKVTEKADNDLMIADACIQQQKGSTTQEGVITENSVTQTFRHALTKVRFSFITTTESIPVFVQNITTTALYNKGDLTVDFVDDLKSSDWDTQTTNSKVSFTDDCITNIDFAAKNVTEVWEDGATDAKTPVASLADKSGITLKSNDYTPLDTWLMIPQTLSEQTVTITYILNNRQFKRTFPLYATNLASWEPNQFVTYYVTIAPNMITFDATVEDWTPKEVTVNDSSTDSASE